MLEAAGQMLTEDQVLLIAKALGERRYFYIIFGIIIVITIGFVMLVFVPSCQENSVRFSVKRWCPNCHFNVLFPKILTLLTM